MSEQAGLLQAAIDNPDDDAIRFVLADWLDEHGEGALPEFIRAQIRLDRSPPWERFHQEARKGRHLVFGNNFEKDLPALPAGLAWTNEPFHRGFPANIRGSLPAFLGHAAQLFARAPIQGLEVDGRNE